MKILAFDLETTGLLEEPGTRVIELAWAVYDTELRRVVKSQSRLMNNLGTGEVPEHITKLNGITTGMLRTHGLYPVDVLDEFFGLVGEVDALFARNGVGFDWPLLVREAETLGMLLPEKRPLIDDYLDIRYKEGVRGCTLSHVAADHGFLNPFPHTGIGDVLTLLRVMEAGGYDWDSALRSAQTPMVEVHAVVSFDDKELAKERKFQWEPKTRVWWKRMRAAAYDPASYPFKTELRKVPG